MSDELQNIHGESRLSVEGARRKVSDVIAEHLWNAVEYVPVKDLAEWVGVKREKIYNHMGKARLRLAERGIIIVNGIKMGYRVGTVGEYKVEAQKSVKRSMGHLNSTLRIIRTLRERPEYNQVLMELQADIAKSLSGMSVKYYVPRREDYASDDAFLNAQKRMDQLRATVPDFIRDDPDEV